MIEQDFVKEPAFSFWFNRNYKEGEGGEIVFGGVNPHHYEGEQTFVPVTQKGYWQFDMGDVLIDGQSTGGFFCAGGCAAIAYSGTSLLAGPTTIIVEINQRIGAAGIVSQECKAVVAEYRQLILDLLLAQAQPGQICAQIGLYSFDGTRGISIGIESVVNSNRDSSNGLQGDVMCTASEIIEKYMKHMKMDKSSIQNVVLVSESMKISILTDISRFY